MIITFCYRIESKVIITSKKTDFTSASKPVASTCISSLYFLSPMTPKIVKKILTISPDIFTCCRAWVYHCIIYRKQFSHIFIILDIVLPFLKIYLNVNGINYKKAIFMKFFIVPQKSKQLNLFSKTLNHDKADW